MLLEQPYGSVPDFSWISLRGISHSSILSSDGASGKPGAIQLLIVVYIFLVSIFV